MDYTNTTASNLSSCAWGGDSSWGEDSSALTAVGGKTAVHSQYRARAASVEIT